MKTTIISVYLPIYKESVSKVQVRFLMSNVVYMIKFLTYTFSLSQICGNETDIDSESVSLTF